MDAPGKKARFVDLAKEGPLGADLPTEAYGQCERADSDHFNVQSRLVADQTAVVSASCRELALAHLAAARVPTTVDYNIMPVK